MINVSINVLLVCFAFCTTHYVSPYSHNKSRSTEHGLDLTNHRRGEAAAGNSALKKDDFQYHMCRERLHRLDYKQILKACQKSLPFGMHIYDKTLRTNPKLTTIPIKEIRESGKYSTFKIKTFDHIGRAKVSGGDSFRIFVNGTEGQSLEPTVYDLNDGEYDVSFLVLDAGVYKVSVILEGSLCSSYVDPPHDWFRKGSFDFFVVVIYGGCVIYFNNI